MKKRPMVFTLLACFCFIVFAVLHFLNQKEIPVLGYHRINNVDHLPLTLSTEEFDAQMQYLQTNGYSAITLDELVSYIRDKKDLPYKSVVITFDDGYEDNYVNAYPILKKYDLDATVFLISDYINRPNYLTWNEIYEMQKNHIHFEGHTFNHPHFDKLTAGPALKQQLSDSKTDLESHLGHKVEYLAYPYGDYNETVIAAAKSYGYKAAFTVHLGDDSAQDDLFTLNRVPIFQTYQHTFLHFWLNIHFPYIMNMIQKAFPG